METDQYPKTIAATIMNRLSRTTVVQAISLHGWIPYPLKQGTEGIASRRGIALWFDHALVCILVSLSLTGCTPRNEDALAARRKQLLEEIGLPVANRVQPSEASNASLSTSEYEPAPSIASDNEKDGMSLSTNTDMSTERTERILLNSTPSQIDERSTPWIDPNQIPRMTWEIQYVGNQPVGYVHRWVETDRENGRLKIQAESRTILQRNGKSIDQEVALTSIERMNGELIRIEGTIKNETRKTRFLGVVLGEELRLEVSTEGVQSNTKKLKVPWNATLRGPFAIEQSLLRHPMREQEVREVSYFDPIQQQVVNARLEAMDYLDTAKFDGSSQRLLEVQSTAQIGETVTRALLWLDENGDSQKSYLPGIDVRSFRCDPVSARYVISRSELEALKIRDATFNRNAHLFRKESENPDPTDDQPVTFDLEFSDREKAIPLPSRTNQVVTTISPRSLKVIVYPISSDSYPIEGLDSEDAVTPFHRLATPVLNANHPQVQRFVQDTFKEQLIADDASTVQKADAIRKAIAETWELIPFDKKISIASEVLRSKQADCFDQAVLLTASLRAAQIPSRIVYGLRFQSPKAKQMTLHAWGEYFDGSKWLPIDSTSIESSRAIDRIRLSDTSMESLNPYEPILSIIKLMPNLEISLAR
jgi:hypothetical protein